MIDEAELDTWCATQAATPRERFDTRMFSFALLTWGEHHGFLFVGHHAVCDGTTCDLLFGEIVRCYDARRSGVTCAPGTFGSYRDFIATEQAYLASDACTRERAVSRGHPGTPGVRAHHRRPGASGPEPHHHSRRS